MVSPDMRLHVFSDLHLEFGTMQFSPEVRSGALAELVLLAGDIDLRRRAPLWAAETFAQPVALIGGNHEPFGDSLYATIAASRKAAERASRNRKHRVRFLERETWVMNACDGTSVRVIAATLWTDFEVQGRGDRRRAMAAAHHGMSDFERIRIRDSLYGNIRRLEPHDQLRLHEISRTFLADELGKRFDGITIVMTHHAPSLRSVPSKHRDDALTPAYASDMEHLIERFRPALWVHGHVHSSVDYAIGGTRVICNPRGYIPDELNPSFDPQLVVEIG
jgi:predicted phosphodiesterase